MRSVSIGITNAIEDNRSIAFSGKLRLYKSRTFFSEAGVTLNQQPWMTTLLDAGTQTPEAIYYDTGSSSLISVVVNGTSPVADEGTIEFYVNNSGVAITCSLTANIYCRPGIFGNKLYYFSGTQWMVATLDVEGMVTNGLYDPIISTELYLDLNAQGSIYPVSDTECALVYLDEGFARPAYIGADGILRPSTSRFINPINLLAPSVAADMDKMRCGGAAKLGDKVFIYQSMINGEVSGIHCTTDSVSAEILWSDISTSIPTDLSMFEVGNVFTYGQRVYICGSLRRTEDFASSNVFTILTWSIDGLTFSLDRRTLVTTTMRRYLCAVTGTSVCFTTLQRFNTSSAPYYILLESAEYSDYAVLNVSSSSASSFQASLVAGDETPFDDPIVDTGSMADLQVGVMLSSGFEWIPYSALVVSSVSKSLNDGKKTVTLSLVSDAIWHTQVMAHPFYMEFLGRDVIVDDVSAMENLYKLEAIDGVECSLECDTWQLSGSRATSSPVKVKANKTMAIMSPKFDLIAAKFPTFGNDTTYDIKVYGWSRTANGAPNTSENGEIYAKIIVEDLNSVRSTITATVAEVTSSHTHFPQTWHTSAARAGSNPVVYQIANPGAGWKIIKVGVNVVAPSTGAVLCYIERIEMPRILMRSLTTSATGNTGWGGGIAGDVPGPGNNLLPGPGTWGEPFEWDLLGSTSSHYWNGFSEGWHNNIYVHDNKFFVCGTFAHIADLVGANSVACFDLDSRTWSKFGNGFTDGGIASGVGGLAWDSLGNMYAACGLLGLQMWDGNTWNNIGLIDSPSAWRPLDIVIDSNDIMYVLGDSWEIYGLGPAGAYHTYDVIYQKPTIGGTWTQIGGGILINYYMSNSVYKIFLDENDNLYIAGNWNAGYLQKWDGVALSTVGNNVNDTVYDVQVKNSNIYIIGGTENGRLNIYNNGTGAFDSILSYDLYNSMPGYLDAMKVSGNNLYISVSDNGITHLIWTYDGTPDSYTENPTNFAPIGIGNQAYISIFAVLEHGNVDELFICGGWASINSETSRYVARYTPTYTPGELIIPPSDFNVGEYGDVPDEPLPVESISTSKKGIAEMLFATIPYQAKNFSVMTSWTVVGPYSTVGNLGLAMDNENFLLGYVKNNKIGLMLRRNGIDTTISEMAYTFDMEAAPFDIRFTHIDGLFTIDLKLSSVAEWPVIGTIFKYQWTYADGTISPSDIIFHVGAYSIIDPPKFRTTSFQPASETIPVMPNPVNIDGVNEFLALFPNSGQVDCEDVIYTYTSKYTGVSVIRGPFQVRSFEEYEGVKAIDYTRFNWDGISSALSGYLHATNDGQVFYATTANWRPTVNSVYNRNSVRVKSADFTDFEGAYNQKIYTTNALLGIDAVPISGGKKTEVTTIHPEGAFVFLDHNDKITLHYFVAANSDPDQTVGNLIEKVTRIAGSDAVFPGDKTYDTITLIDGNEGITIS